jgi:hypothetical protein
MFPSLTSVLCSLLSVLLAPTDPAVSGLREVRQLRSSFIVILLVLVYFRIPVRRARRCQILR